MSSAMTNDITISSQNNKSWYQYQVMQQKVATMLSKQAVEINLDYSQHNGDSISISEPPAPEEAT